MPKYIDVEKLMEYKVDCCVSLTEWQQGQNDTIDTIMDEQPTIDAEPVRHGHWIFNPKDAIEMMFTLPKCSKCGAESADSGNYCSNCGAKMDEKKEDMPMKHGHWIRNDNGTYSCSKCHSWIPEEQHYYARYCLFCGAKMDEVI